MAFDRTNPSDLLTLKTEVNTDLIGMGYAAAGTDAEIVALLNDPASNVEDPIPTGQAALTIASLMKIIFPISVASGDQFKVQLLFEASNSQFDDISQYRSDVAALSVALGNALAADVRDLSRAEVLFGVVDANGTYETVNLTVQDWIAARDS